MRSRFRSERGANLVEFALVAPMLILLLVGVIEFSWTLASNLDVKQGAREAARLTAVNNPDSGNTALAAEICSRMDLVGMDSQTFIIWVADDETPNVGEGVSVTVSAPHKTLTGLVDFLFAGVTRLESTVETRIEQPPTWSSGKVSCP